MKYKVGDKVRVRRDLEEGETYGGWDALEDMVKMRGEIVTIRRVRSSAYELEETNSMWSDEMLEGLVEEELTAEEAIRILGGMCRDFSCCEWPIYELIEDEGSCDNFRAEKPDKVIEVLKQQKKNHEKKEIKTEIVDLIKVMKEVCDNETCIYAYEIDINEEDVGEKMNELVKQYYEENGGKIYAKFERLCRVKS